MKLESSIAACVTVMGLALFGFVSGCGSDGSRGATGAQGTAGTGGASNGAQGGSGDTPATGGAKAQGGGGGAVAGGANKFGLPCASAADCGAGLTCLLSSGSEFDGGGVSNGLCTLDCSADLTAAVSATSVCQDADPNAICLQVSDTKAYCVESCMVGASQVAKCHGRHDMACADPESVGVGYCKPTCRGDFDCQGRVCDLSDGVCQSAIDPARKLPDGSKCNPDAMPDICHGACVGIVEDNGATSGGFCSGFCKLGEAGCGTGPTASAKPDAYCLFGTDPNADLDDLGFCAELCDCNADCKNPDFVCTMVPGLSMQAGRAGACGPANAGGMVSKGIPCGATTGGDAGP
jgi:hypothetical protein